jgi:large subunit ribosomal protein L6
MSRIGKKEITIPAGTTFEVKDNVVKVTGKLGTLERKFEDVVEITVENNAVKVTPKKDDKFSRAM